MALGQGYYGSCLDSFSIIAFFVACFMYSYHNNLLPHTFNTTFVTNRQVHTYNTRNANNYRPYFCRNTVLINLDCKTSCGLIRDGLFTNWQFGLVIDHQQRDLQILVLDRGLFTLYSNSFGRTDSIVFDKLNKPPSLLSLPSNVFETNKPCGELNRGFTLRDLSSA